jgi:hypothetical protein
MLLNISALLSCEELFITDIELAANIFVISSLNLILLVSIGDLK